MAEKDYTGTIIAIGALALGGYFIYNWIKNSSLGKTAEAIGGGINTITKTTETTIREITQPMIDPSKTAPIGVTTPSVINYMFPPSGIPQFVTNFVTDKTGAINPWTAVIKATETAMLTLGMGKKQTLKAESKSTIPIVTKTTTGVSILRPLEIVNTGKLIKSVALESRKTNSPVTGTIPISISKVATVTKSPGISTKTVIQGKGSYKKPGGM